MGIDVFSMTSSSPLSSFDPDLYSGNDKTSSRYRPRHSTSQRFSPDLLLHGHGSPRNDFPSSPSDHLSPPPVQRLPRAQAPPSLAGSSVRPSIIQSRTATDYRPQTKDSNRGLFPLFSTSYRQTRNPPNATVDDNFQPDALWAEMQRTLADVEISAMSASTSSNVFGAAHSQTLDDLRTAQLSLAHAWARSEADDIGDDKDNTDTEDDGSDAVVKPVGLPHSPRSHVKPDASPLSPGKPKKPHDRRRASSSASNATIGRNLEEETERDIQLARKRREANDRYFHQVNQGVLDVVAKLDVVAAAMMRVERESREIWDDKSVDGTSTMADDSIVGDTPASIRARGGTVTNGEGQATARPGMINGRARTATMTTGNTTRTELGESRVSPKKGG